jgi:hypothetical protein
MDRMKLIHGVNMTQSVLFFALATVVVAILP